MAIHQPHNIGKLSSIQSQILNYVVQHMPMECVKGFKNESKIFKPIFQCKPSIPVKDVKRVLDIIMSPVIGYAGIYIFHKTLK